MTLVHRQKVISEAVKKNTVITLASFFELLKKHDWFSCFSDCSATYRRGNEKFEQLTYIASTHELFSKLLNEYKHYIQNKNNDALEPEKLAEYSEIKTSYSAILESDNGILLRTCCEFGHSSDVWDNTSSGDGHFNVTEIDGRNIGVFPSWEIALSVASYATSSPDGGYNDVIIENVSVYDSFDEWFM